MVLKEQFNDNRNTANEDNHTGDIVVQNGMHKNAVESRSKKPASSCQPKTTAFLKITMDMLNKDVKMLCEIKKLAFENELKNKVNEKK
jgi:hypothetical protein